MRRFEMRRVFDVLSSVFAGAAIALFLLGIVVGGTSVAASTVAGGSTLNDCDFICAPTNDCFNGCPIEFDCPCNCYTDEEFCNCSCIGFSFCECIPNP